MNQILSTNMPDRDNDKNKQNNTMNRENDKNYNFSNGNISNSYAKNQKNPTNTKSVIKVFAIILIIFALALISAGGYEIYKNMAGTTTEIVKPTISVENKTEKTLLIKITSQTGLSQYSYGWNDEERTIVDSNNKKYAEQVIDIPSGSNILYIVAEDTNGQNIEYKKTYEFDSNINIENNDTEGTIVISYDGENEVSYMTYKWDDSDEIKIDIEDNAIKEEIDAIKGIHTLTIQLMYADGTSESKVQKVKGTSKPTLTVEKDEDEKYFVIKASDETSLSKVEFMIDDDSDKEYRVSVTEKEFEYKIPVLAITEKLEVRVYNSDDIMTTVIKEI